jgi:triacylglycerol esterase/lipase EstA (alpha/beta hydrolase family)
MIDTYNKNIKLFQDLFIADYSRARSKLMSAVHTLYYHKITDTPAHLLPDTSNPTFSTDKEGLIVYIHGLGSNPKIGRYVYGKEIQKQAPNRYNIWVPDVVKKGNCSLEEAANPILAVVRKYIEDNPGKPVQLIGHSNGGRIAAYIETHTRDMNVNMRVTGIAGVFKGTDAVAIGKILGLATLFLSSTLTDELQTNSPLSKELIRDMRQKIENGSRTYTFYATVDDIAIPNYYSCIPKIDQNEEYVVKKGCSHNSIQHAVLQEEIKKVIDFMNTFYTELIVA